jgi:hypothetical protein
VARNLERRSAQATVPDPGRVVQLFAPGSDGLVGSGYLIASGLVLTAAHVVIGRESVGLVIGDPAAQRRELTVGSGSAICDQRADVALLAVDPVLGPVAPAPWAALDQCSADLAVTALGFPQFSQTADGRRRLRAVTATARPSVNVRGAALRFVVDPAVGDDGDPSARDGAWGGMSGAVLWGGGRVLGVITEHHTQAGAPVLTAALLSGARAELRDALSS